MKQGMDLQALAAEIVRRAEVKKDYVADTRELLFKSNGKSILAVAGQGEFQVNEVAHNQIAGALDIPAKFYNHLRVKHPEMLDYNVNELFKRQPVRRLVRTLDGESRAFLSDRYRMLDNEDVAQSILPIVFEQEMKVASCDVTPSKMYIKALFPKIAAEVVKGDVVQAGLVISNSEVGLGAFSVQPLIFRLVCTNGMISADHSMRRHHVGAKLGGGDEAFQFFRDETIQADDRAFMLKCQDIVRACLTEAKFLQIVDRMRDATGQRLQGDPVKSVEVVQKRFALNEGEKNSVLRNLIEGGDLSRYGMMNAVTATAKDVDDYDRATELERVGGKVIELAPSEWSEIATAA